MSSPAAILRLPARKTTTTRTQRRGHALSASGSKLRLVTKIDKNAAAMATEYSVRLAPYAIARIKLDRVSADHFWIDWVYVPPGFRDAGLGGQLMRRVLQDADAHGVRLSLEARACGETDQAALERWYEKFGFVRTGKRGDFGPIFVRMIAKRYAA
jgi:ribosomal protein S18 acetylase RimI-like enzyme